MIPIKITSPLTQGRELKSVGLPVYVCANAVAPHAGARIEIAQNYVAYCASNRRPSRRGEN